MLYLRPFWSFRAMYVCLLIWIPRAGKRKRLVEWCILGNMNKMATPLRYHTYFAAMIWGSASTFQLQLLQDLQTKTLIKLVKDSGIDEKEVNTLCNIPLLKHRGNEQLAIIIFNILHRDHDSYLVTPLETVNYPYATGGHKIILVPPKPNANSMKRTVTYRGIQIWNELPNETILSNRLSKDH